MVKYITSVNCKQVNDIVVVKRLKILLSFIISGFFYVYWRLEV